MDVNGLAASAHRLVRPGDAVDVTFEGGRRSFLVRALAARRVPKAVARTLYEETTPPVPPEVAQARRLERQLAPRRDEGKGKLSKRERRERDRLRGY